MENGILHLIRPLWVPGNAFWAFNAPASFQGYITKIVAEKLDIFDIFDLDDIFTYIEDPM